MKKITAVLCACIFFATASETLAQKEYAKGDVLLNFGFGAGYYYAGGVPLVASAEFAINDAISVGPYLGFTSYRRNFGGYRFNYTFIDIGGRGSYHFSKHINLPEQLDLYGGVSLGFVVADYNVDNEFFGTYADPYESTLRGGLFGGARWYFTESFSANAELGIVGGISPLLLGISFKL